MRVLVYGLPGAGKTHLAKRLVAALGSRWRHVNADEVREAAGDWDFTREGRIRQAERLAEACSRIEGRGFHVVVDAVAALAEQRRIIAPDFSVLLWTIERSACRYNDTAEAFDLPMNPIDEPVERWYNERHEYDRPIGFKQLVEGIQEHVPAGLMVGRFQPWHAGHRGLFDKIHERYGKVVIGVRSAGGVKNPLDFDEVKNRIDLDLQDDGVDYRIIQLPNIAGIHWGRDVGYQTGPIQVEGAEHYSGTAEREKLRREHGH